MLKNTFCHIPGIGLITERRLWADGIESWDLFSELGAARVTPRRRQAVARHLDTSRLHARERNPGYFADLLPPHLHWRLFPEFRDRVFNALKSGGHFILEYIDGLKRVASMSEPKEVVEQGVDSLIVRRFKGYDPATSTYTMEFRRLSTNEVYEATEYVYVGPLIRLLMEIRFEFLESVQLDHSFMDVYIKR